jgi:hypothetical protein
VDVYATEIVFIIGLSDCEYEKEDREVVINGFIQLILLNIFLGDKSRRLRAQKPLVRLSMLRLRAHHYGSRRRRPAQRTLAFQGLG